MLKLAKYLHTQFWLFVAWLIISTAVILTLLRLYLPQLDLDPFAQQIERIVEETAGVSLRIGDMHAKMSTVHLALQFDEISLLDPQTGAVLLNFRQAHADIHLLRSLWQGRLVLGKGMLVGGRLDLLRRRDGTIVVNGLPGSSSGGGQASLVNAFLRHGQLRVRDSEVLWREEAGGRRPLHLKSVNANLFNQDGRHQLTALAGIESDNRQEMLRLVADLWEADENPLQLSGRIYLNGQGIGMAGRLQGLLPAGGRLKRGRMDLELWGKLDSGALTQLEGAIALRNLELTGVEAPSLSLQRLSSNLSWRREADGWLFALDRLLLMHENRLWPPGRLVLSQQQLETGGTELLAGADYLGIRQAARLAVLLMPGDGQLRQVLAGLDPAGHLSRFRLARRQFPGQESQWQIRGAVTQFSSLPWQAVPGMDGLDMHFAGDQGGGALRLGSKHFSTEMPKLFRERLNANRLDGNFDWRYSPQQGLWLKTSDLRVSTDHLQTLSRLQLQIPLQEGKKTIIDMQTDFWEGDGSQKSRYLPVGIMPKPLVDWLDRSLVGGHVKSGSMLLYGPLKSFPYTDLEGRFEVLFGIEDMVLDYKDGWPRLEEGVAETQFLNNSLKIKLLEGKMLNASLRSGTATIRRLKGASPVEIKGDFSGDLGQMLRFLEETPLQARFGRFTELARGSGVSRVSVDLQVPLKPRDDFVINGRVDLQNAALALEEFDLFIDRLQGSLSFDQRTLRAKGLKGRMFDQPLSLDIAPIESDGKPATRINTSLLANRALLERFMPLSLAAPFSGEAQALVWVDIAHEADAVPVRLHAESELFGMTLDLPQPLGKRAEATRPVALDLAFRNDHKTDLRIEYDALVRALLQNEGEGFLRGEVLIGKGEPALPPSGQLLVRGDLRRLDLDSWTAWLMRQPSGESEQAMPLRFDLLSKQFILAGVPCADAHFQLEQIPEGWRIQVASAQMEGSLVLPKEMAKLPIAAHFKTLRLSSEGWFSQPDEAAAAAGSGDLDPRQVPGMKLQVEQLYIDDKLMGAAQVQWQQAPLGLDMKRFSLVGEGLTLSGEGAWHYVDGAHTSSLRLQGQVASLGRLQEDLKLQLGVSKAPMEFNTELNWPVAPLELDLTSLTGTLNLKVGSGEVTEVDPGVGRLVGLLSLHALGKRLLLDFSDLFAKGLEFDRIEGSFDLKEGSAYTSDLHMEGPSVKVFMEGRIGLKAKDYEQTVTVIPRLSSTLPVVGALAVNPAVGVALAVVQQVIGKHVDSVTQTRYSLRGPWESPQIEKIERAVKPDSNGSMPDLP